MEGPLPVARVRLVRAEIRYKIDLGYSRRYISMCTLHH